MQVLVRCHWLFRLQARNEVHLGEAPVPKPEELLVRQLPELGLREAEIVPRDRERVVPVEPDRLYWTGALDGVFGSRKPNACRMNSG